MSWRDTINNNSAVVTIGAVALLVIALGIMIVSMTGGGGNSAGPTPTGKYFYNLSTKKIYTAPMNTYAPDRSDGGEGVEIVIMTCNPDGCGKDFTGMSIEEVAQAGDFFVAYLERLSDEGKKQMEAMQAKNPEGPPMMDMMMMGGGAPLIRRVDNEMWLNAQNPRHAQAYQAIHAELRTKCPQGKYPRRCMPGQ